MVTPSYQYHQFLYALSTAEAVKLPNGSWSTTAPKWELKASCREETNGKGHTIHTADGRVIAFSSLIQIPKGTAKIDEGTEVIVSATELTPAQISDNSFITGAKKTGLILAQGTCLKYDPGRLHCRLWI